MNTFEMYIASLLRTLLISNKRKKEMAEEFTDHLELLKQEYLLEGVSEKEAVEKAIEAFGRNTDIKNMLGAGIAKNYRTLPNILFGLVLHVLIIRLGSHIPLPGGINYYSAVMSSDPLHVLTGMALGFVSIVWMFTSIGYFIPMLVPKLSKSKFSIIALLIGLIATGYIHVQPSVLTENARIAVCGGLTILCGSLAWCSLGYVILKAADGFFTKLRARHLRTGN